MNDESLDDMKRVSRHIDDYIISYHYINHSHLVFDGRISCDG
jgi:hypothetical protein